MLGRWLRRFGPSVLLAHALAVLVLAHVHYSGWCPKAQAWFWYELAVALGVWPVCIAFVNRLLRPTFAALPVDQRRWFLAIAIGLGSGIAAWWAGVLENTLWLHGEPVRTILGVVLALSRWLAVTAGVAGLLCVTVRVMRGGELVESEPERQRGRLAVPRWRSGSDKASSLLAFLLFLAAVNAFAIWYVRQERIVYYWDYMVYWTKTAELAETLRTESLGDVLDGLRRATQGDDYGPIPALLPAVAAVLFGDSRLVYILAVANLYLVGFALAAVLFVRRMVPNAGAVATVIPLLAVLLCPVAWMPLLRGYLDIGGAAIAVLVVLAYLRKPAGELGWPRAIQLALLLVALTLFRRWYSFFVVAFFFVAGLDTGLAALRGYYQFGWREAIRRAAPLGLAGLWAFALLFAVAGGWVIRAATTNYAADYYAYKSLDPLPDRARLIVDNCGPGTVALAVLGLLVLLAFRDTRRPAIVIAGMVPVMAYHFLRTQDPGPHHYYLFLPAFVLLPSLAWARVSCLVSPYFHWPLVLFPTLAGLAAMFVMFHPQGLDDHERLRPAVSRLHFPPLTRHDLPELVRLLRAADVATPDGGSLAVASSSLAISPTTIATADRSIGEPVIDRRKLRITPEVDRVSGFPEGFFQADVILVVDPPQWHLRPEEQQVVVITAESLLQQRDIGNAFDRLPGEYRLFDPQHQQGVTAYLYRRSRPIAQADFDAYVARLKAAHPSRWRLSDPPPGLEKFLGFPLPKDE